MSRIHHVKVHVVPEGGRDPDTSPLRFRALDGSYYLSHEDMQVAQAQGFVLETLRVLEEAELGVRFILPHDGAVNDPPPESARGAVLARLLAEDRADGQVQIRFLGRNRSIPADGFLLDKAGGDRCYVWQVVPSDELCDRPELAERFRALRAHLAEPDRRVVLSLGAGGLKLFAHATVLRLLDAIGAADHIDEVWGSSAGALVALMYCQGLSPHAIEQTGYDMYAGRYDLALRPSKFQMLRELVRDAILPRDDVAGAGFVDCTASLQRMLAQYCDTTDSVRPFYCTAFNVRMATTEVLTPMEVPEHQRELVRHCAGRDAALASAAVPLLFVPRVVQVDGQGVPYIDGSTTEGVPLFSPTRKFDLDRQAGKEPREKLTLLFVKLTNRPGPNQGRVSKLRLLQTIASAGVEAMHARDAELLAQRPELTLLDLALEDGGPDFFFEPSSIPESIRTAKECFPRQLAAIEQRLRQK